MSSKSIKRIKQIRKKISASLYESTPFGTDGLLVDMLSGLDLEELLKLGNNHSVEITENDNETRIIERYKDENSNEVLYTVDTIITESNNGTNVEMILYKGNTLNIQNQLHTKTITINESSSSTTITLEVDKE